LGEVIPLLIRKTTGLLRYARNDGSYRGKKGINARMRARLTAVAILR